ncbi:hypothetical protein QN277_023063 [Acacia crassicarpa]|uniref:Uncharacterized protein n=1 Tax=Acacia crassicarpa TaxID=499986 RepID=A0AAE1JKC7_9FABA|nr:hypothetical protein QN277_023063 [Acacia crassicarpa]
MLYTYIYLDIYRGEPSLNQIFPNQIFIVVVSSIQSSVVGGLFHSLLQSDTIDFPDTLPLSLSLVTISHFFLPRSDRQDNVTECLNGSQGARIYMGLKVQSEEEDVQREYERMV